MLVFRFSDGYVAQWLSNGAGGWSYQPAVGIGGGGFSGAQIVTGDFNGDGKTDAVIFRSNDGYVAQWSSNGAGGWSYQSIVFLGGSSGAFPDAALIPQTTATIAITGQVTAGGAGLGNVTVTLSGSLSGATTTDANGNYLFNAPAGGSYTVTPSLSGYTFNPALQAFNDVSANQTANFTDSSSSGYSAWNGFWGLPLQASATPSGAGCGDISGTWTETDAYGSSTWNLTQSAGNVSGTVDFSNGLSCGTITYQTVTGQQSNGFFNLTASNPTTLNDGCGYSITPVEQQQVTLSGSCTDGSASWSSNFGSGSSSWKGQIPSSLRVVSIHVYTYDEEVAAGYPPSCAGIVVGVTYQLMDQSNPAKPIKVAGLVPQETITNARVDGIYYGDPIPQFVDIDPSHLLKTDANGTFRDAPFGSCGTAPATQSDTQNIRIVNPNNAGNWVIRTNNWTYHDTSPGHGSVTQH